MPNKKTEESAETGRPRTTPEPTGLMVSWMDDNGKTASQMADDLGIAKSTVYALREGAFCPSLRLATKIEKYTRRAVPASSWLKDEG